MPKQENCFQKTIVFAQVSNEYAPNQPQNSTFFHFKKVSFFHSNHIGKFSTSNRPERRQIMTEEEKKALQAKHRMEEAAARDRVQERKQRTCRLIQEGAILESVYPQCNEMELDTLKAELTARFASSP